MGPKSMTITADHMTMDFNEQTGRLHDTDAQENERTYAMFNHLIGLISLADVSGILALIGTIIMWRVKKDESPFLDDHGREATNFQISLLLYSFLGVAFGFLTFGIGFIIAVPMLIGLFVLLLIGGIRGAMAANRGEYYRYPMCIRFIKGAGEA